MQEQNVLGGESRFQGITVKGWPCSLIHNFIFISNISNPKASFFERVLNHRNALSTGLK